MSNSTGVASPSEIVAPTADRAAVRPALMAVILGFAMLTVVGFAYPAAIHDAAHDTRHAMAFPCH